MFAIDLQCEYELCNRWRSILCQSEKKTTNGKHKTIHSSIKVNSFRPFDEYAKALFHISKWICQDFVQCLNLIVYKGGTFEVGKHYCCEKLASLCSSSKTPLIQKHYRHCKTILGWLKLCIIKIKLSPSFGTNSSNTNPPLISLSNEVLLLPIDRHNSVETCGEERQTNVEKDTSKVFFYLIKEDIIF